MRVAILMAAVLHAAFAAPQFDFLTLKDGKIGVNFGGYHASAGLGGLLTGDAAHGGLSASAGTPYGQQASAGLGGSTAGNPRGFLYANANANRAVGASAGLGGEAGVSGYGGSEAHANGIGVSKNLHAPVVETYEQEIPPQPHYKHVNSIQKIKPPKKYSQTAAETTTNALADVRTSTVAQQSIGDVPQVMSVPTTASDKTTTSAGDASTTAQESHHGDEQTFIVTNVHRLRKLHRERQRLRNQQSQTKIRESTKVNLNAQLPPAAVAEKPTIRPQEAPKDLNQSYADYNAVHSQHFSKTATKSLISSRFGVDAEPPQATTGLTIDHQYGVTNTVHSPQVVVPGPGFTIDHQYGITKTIHSPHVVQRALDIPIGILQVIQNAFRW